MDDGHEKLIAQLENLIGWYINLRQHVFRDGTDPEEVTEARAVIDAVRAQRKAA